MVNFEGRSEKSWNMILLHDTIVIYTEDVQSSLFSVQAYKIAKDQFIFDNEGNRCTTKG